MKINDKLIVALDFDSLKKAIKIVDILDKNVTTYKVGLQLFTKEGYKSLEFLKKRDKKIFLDLKFHDIPNTVVGAVSSVLEHGVDMLTIHAMGGFDMMESVAKLIWQKRKKKTPAPKVFAVTLLTSLDSAFLQDMIGATSRSIEEEILILAQAARSAGIDGVVASPLEVKMLKQKCGKDILILTPGIRPTDFDKNDQQRTSTPYQAIKDGADYIVVGRPITTSTEPLKVVKDILKEIKNGLKDS